MSEGDIFLTLNGSTVINFAFLIHVAAANYRIVHL